jgi:transcriptional regulator with XRE-family HTH domain
VSKKHRRGGGASLGETIVYYRNLAPLTQEDLAETAGCSRSHVSRIENGVHIPHPKLLRRIATAIDCEYDRLLTLAILEGG